MTYQDAQRKQPGLPRKNRHTPIVLTDDLVNRFWSYVDVRGEDECWEWTGARHKSGYGRVKHEAKTLLAHRVAWAVHDSDPGDLLVLHTCDVPACCNVAHLFLGTNADNTADAVSKGRHVHGESSGVAKFSETEVLDIRSRRQAGETYRAIAERYGASIAAIYSIAHGVTWGHVGEPVDHSLLHQNTMLTSQGVRDIRRRYAAGETQADLAREYGVSPSNMYAVVNNKTWRDIDRIPEQNRDPGTKLTVTKAREIRIRFADGETQANLARVYGVTQSNIYAIVNHKTWKHIN
jgi:Mor family transcriptional regulator